MPLSIFRFASVVLILTFSAFFLFCKKTPEESIVPAITSLDPPQGCIDDLMHVNIRGVNLQVVTRVNFGPLELGTDQFDVSGAGDVLTIYPDDLAGLSTGQYTVVLEAPDGRSNSVNFAITNDCAPQLFTLTPDEAQAGDTVVLTGKYLTGANLEVLFTTDSTDLALATILARTETQLTVIVPPPAVSGPVIVKNALGMSNSLTFILVQPDPDPPTLFASAGSVARGCMLTLEGHGLAPQGTTKLTIYNGTQVLQTVQQAGFLEFTDQKIKIRIAPELPLANLRFEVTTHYGAASAFFQIEDFALRALDVLPPANYIGGPLLINKDGLSVERIVFGAPGQVVQNLMEQQTHALASRVPTGVPAGPTSLQLESTAGCISNSLPFEVVDATSPWGPLAGNSGVVIPNTPPGTNIVFSQQGTYWKFAFHQPASEVYILNLGNFGVWNGDTSKVFVGAQLNGESLPQTFGRFFANGSFLEIEVDGKKYRGQMDNAYPPLPSSSGSDPTPKQYVFYPLQPGEIAEMVFPYALDQVQPSVFSAGDTITVTGKYFPPEPSFAYGLDYFLYKVDDLNTVYSSYYNAPDAVLIRVSHTAFKMVVPAGLPAGNYLLSFGQNHRSNGIAVTIQ